MMADYTIVLCGAAGKGIETVEALLTRIFKGAGYHVFATKEYMSRVRGGENSTVIRVSDQPVRAYSERIDVLIPFDAGAVEHLRHRISKDTVILGDREKLGLDGMVDAPYSKIANEVGGEIYANVVAAAVLSSLFKVDIEEVYVEIRERFAKKKPEYVPKNLKAAELGYKLGEEIGKREGLDYRLERDSKVREEVVLRGADSLALGTTLGGCNFLAAYPMTPSTGVFTFLAQHGRELSVITEQAEDEISAVNMAIGAWYAGARAMASTAGGGFALMVEGISLAGMLESPLVVHVGQRPGPATGLPTRTAQEDLELVLHSGHGEFPRMIYAPGNIEETIDLGQKAFNQADAHQCPVFILTDQYLMDSYYDLPAPDLDGYEVVNRVVKTGKNYKRYVVTADGISPRGIPGYGEGLVYVDSDEHDTTGRITEDMGMRTAMVQKRLRKLDGIRRDAIAPTLTGAKGYTTLVVCWGSTKEIVAEAIKDLDGVSMLHFSQVYPIHESAKGLIEKAGRRIILEGNATSQFGKLLRREVGVEFDERILKYDGIQFTVEEVKKAVGR